MSPGVGKTYEMLRAARRRKAEGGDVVVGRGRDPRPQARPRACCAGWRSCRASPIDYRGRTLLEFDIDAALARQPDLLLVDEYAHSNAPGSRHPKRWQDVEEILAAGIDVWTTLNVQHLESLVDVVLRITGVRQRETVPDSALSRADDIELVDITPDELRERLAEGKVYVPETARLASENFFKVENLTALRELALRRAAQTVDDQLVAPCASGASRGPGRRASGSWCWSAATPWPASLVRAGRRLSDMMMDAPWTVAHVERPASAGRRRPARSGCARPSSWPNSWAARPWLLTGDDVVRTVLDYAHRNNVTQIVVGKSRRPPVRELLGRSLAAACCARRQGVADPRRHRHGDAEAASRARAKPAQRRCWDWRGYAASARRSSPPATVAALAAGLALRARRSGRDLSGCACWRRACCTACGPRWRRRPSAFLVYNFLFLEPRYSFAIGSPTDVLTCVVFLAVALATGWLAGRVRDQARRSPAPRLRRLRPAGRQPAPVGRRGPGDRRPRPGRTGRRRRRSARRGAAARRRGHRRRRQAPLTRTPSRSARRRHGRRALGLGEGRGGRGRHRHPAADPLDLPAAAGRARPRPAWRGSRPRPWPPGSDEERLVLALLDQGAVALERAELAGEARRGRDPAPRRPLPLGPAELGQPRPAHAAVHRAGLGHHPDRLRRDA